MQVTWVLENGVFASGDASLRSALAAAGDRVVDWQDDWWSTGRWPRLEGPVIVRAALGNADRIARELPWRPGAFCDTAAFCCSRWYDAAAPWLLNRRFVMATARALTDAPSDVLAPIGTPERVFVRPDSPLKPFAGRVVATAELTLRALDHGFYYDDEHLPVVAAPVVPVDAEWRYVVVDGVVVAGSAYQADGRSALPDDPRGEPWQLAQTIAAAMPAPQRVYVLDLCRSEGELRLLELNPFAGADLYATDAAAIVAAVDAVARSSV
ncbi:MAG: ATP-grasp domain-containing protein [Planctomycetota bacterium]